MKKLLLLLVAATALAAQAQHTLRFDDLVSFRRIGAPKISPDGKWIVYDASTPDLQTNARRSAIFLMPASGGESKQISDGVKQDEGPAWSPNGKSIAYVSNRAGGAKQVYLYDLAMGSTIRLTALAGGAGSVKWMPAGDALVVVSDVYPDCGVDPECTQQKDVAAQEKPSQARIITSLMYRHWNAWQEPTRAHILYVPLRGGAVRDLTPGAFDAPPFSLGGGGEFDVSPDGKELVYARDTSDHPERSTNSDLFIVPVVASAGGGTAKRITRRTGADTSPAYSPDGRYIAYRSQARAGYESDLWELWLYDRDSGQSERLIPKFNDWVESVRWSPDSKTIYFTAPLAGTEAIYAYPLGFAPTIVHNTGSASEIEIAPDGKTIYFDQSTLSRPTDIYSQALDSRGAAKRLTRDNDARLAQIEMGHVGAWAWKGAGDTQVFGHVVWPPTFDMTKKYPAIVLIHGGPQGAWSDGWSYRWNAQMFAARGYFVLMPNPRGSYGFGQKFVEEISQDWGGKAYTDIMNGVDLLASQNFVDANRIGAAGASYGGYMINWILGHDTRFKALVSHDGLYNLETAYGATEELWFPEWEFGGTPWDHPEQYEKWSPHRFVKNFATPTLVIHGELDYRVPVDQGMQLFTALQRKGVPSKLLLFPDEGHWVLKPQNSKVWHQTVLDWLDQWLKP
jgi:dipeptidyl aminopeptidase/acylaminoacyl peptidase